MAERDFKELLEIINKTVGSIEKLKTQITTLEKEMSSGNYGTFQLKQFNAEVEKLQANLAKKQVRLENLVEEKSFRDFEILNKQIETLQKNVATGKGFLGLFKTDDPQYQKLLTQIKNAETALKSLESRKFTQFNALGQRKDESLSGGNLGERIGPPGTETGGVSIRAKAEEVRKAGREIAERTLKEIQYELLRGAIEARGRPVSPGLAAAAAPYTESSAQRLARKRAEDEAFFSSRSGQQATGPVNRIPHPTDPDKGKYNERLNEVLKKEIAMKERAIAAQKAFYDNHLKYLRDDMSKLRKGSEEELFLRQAYNNTLKDKIKFESGLAGGRVLGKSEENIRENFKKGIPRLDDAINKQEALEKQRLEALQEQINAHKKYANALRVAAEKGFAIGDLKNVYNRGTDIDRLQFAKKDNYGVDQKLDLYTNSAGKVTPGISNQFRTFGQGVVRDIGELTKWSIALAAVYGPLNKLAELTQEMIANQTKLAEATISVNSSFLDQGKIFDIAAQAANEAGESVGGVIDAFTQAYRATGGAGNQVERLTIAQKLLSDSLVLSKLSTLDQATAIDTLSAALRQSGDAQQSSAEALSNGTTLLDKWVRVTKIANIDLGSLATGFAVLGDSAETAGISTDQLNGLLAALAETGVSSGRELANTARRVVGFFQTDQARDALESIGVAFEDSAGKARPLLDVMKEVADLRKSGVIGDTQFSELTNQIGQGVRGAASITTLLENFGRVNEVAEESSRANGDAQAALAKQLETVQTALDRLGNAFSSLAQTMGTEGGFLGLITEGVEGMTSLVKIFDSLTGVLGKATPALAAFIATSLLLKSRGSGSIQNFLGDLGGGSTLEFATLDDRFDAASKGQSAAKPSRGGTLASTFLGTGAIASISQGIGVALIPALQNFANKDDRFGDAKGTANIAGGVLGGVIGSLTGVGPIIGATIGTAIAEVFVSKSIDFITDPTAYSNKTKLGESFAPQIGDIGTDKALQNAEAGLYKSIGGGSEAFGRFFTGGMQKTANSLIDQLNDAIKNQDASKLESVFGGRYGQQNTELLEKLGITPEFARQAFTAKDEKGFQTGKPIEASAENLVYQLADEASKKIYDAVLSAVSAEKGDEDAPTAFSNLVAANKAQFGPVLAAIQEDAKSRVQGERLTGDIKGTEFARQTTAIAGFDTKALNYFTAFGDEFIKVNEGIDDATGAFQAFSDIVITGAADSIPEITAIAGEVQTLINLLSDPVLNKERLEELYGSVGAAQAKLPELQATGAAALDDVYQQTRLSRLQSQVPNIQGDINKPLVISETVNELAEVQKNYNQLEKEFYEEYLGFTREEVDIITAGFESWAQVIEESGEVFFQKIESTDPALWQQAIAKAMEEGKLPSQQDNPFGIQQLDMTSQEGAGLQGQIDYFSQYLAENFSQYQQNPEEFGVIFSDYVTDVLHGDNLAVQLALQGLNDKAQKQLDGQYNIPEGATFWVPLTAAYYRPKTEGAGMGGGSIDTGPLDDSASNLDQAAFNLSEAANLFKESQLRGAQIAEGMPRGVGGREGRPDTANGLRYREGSRQAAEAAFEQNRDRISAMDSFRTSESASSRDSVNSTPSAQLGSFVESIKNGIMSAFRALESVPGMDRFGSQGDGAGRLGGSIGGRMPDTSVNAAQTAKLDIRFESTTQLMVDGRVLATIIKPHLASDLLKLEGSQGSVTKRYVI